MPIVEETPIKACCKLFSPYSPVRAGTAICKFNVSGFRSQLQNSLFCCLILQIGVSYRVNLMYYLNYEQNGL